jgi:hypothetical protein
MISALLMAKDCSMRDTGRRRLSGSAAAGAVIAAGVLLTRIIVPPVKPSPSRPARAKTRAGTVPFFLSKAQDPREAILCYRWTCRSRLSVTA